MLKVIKDTTEGVLEYPCYWCGKLKNSSVGYFNHCSPECEKIKTISNLLKSIDEGNIYIGVR